MNWNTHEYLDRMREPERKTGAYIYKKITNIAINTFNTKIEGIENAPVEFILWHYGICSIWNHPILGVVVTPCTVMGYDINGIPNRWKPIIKNDSIPADLPELTRDNAVIIYDTPDPEVFRHDCLVWIEDYADVTETIRTQVFNQKTPLLAISGSKGLVEKLKRGIVDIKRNVKVLFVDTDFKDKLTPLDFNAPYNVENLSGYRRSIENEMLEFIGVDHTDGFQKKERLIVDEQESNDEQLNYVLAGCLRSREEGLAKLSMFGLTGSTEISGLVRPIEKIEEGEDGSENDEL